MSGAAVFSMLRQMRADDLNVLLAARQSTKSFAGTSLRAGELHGLLSAVFGVAPDGRRSYGSAHARYPVTATVVVGDVRGLAAGSYRITGSGGLRALEHGDHRELIAQSTIDAAWAVACPVLLVLSANVGAERAEFTSQAEGRGERFIAMEIGLIAQTVHLVAAGLDLGTALIAGVHDEAVRRLPESIVPPGDELLAVMPLGRATRDGTAASG